MLKLMSQGKQRSRSNHRETTRERMVKLVFLALTAAAAASLAVIAVNHASSAASNSTYVKPPNSDIIVPTQVVRPTAVFIGDSYTAGAGSTDAAHNFAEQVGVAEGWIVKNAGRGGTGYLNTASKAGCGLDYCPNYREMIPIAEKSQPSIIVVSGGRNDLNKSGVAAQIAAFYTDLRTAFPKATILATSPLWDDDRAPAGIATIAGEVKAAVKAAGGTYLDIGQPLAGKPDLIGPDLSLIHI